MILGCLFRKIIELIPVRKREGLDFNPVQIRDEAVAAAPTFDGSDLAANRAGYLSKKQMIALLDRKKGFRIEIIVGCIIGTVTLYVGSVMFELLRITASESSRAFGSLTAFLFLALLLVFAFGLLAYFVRQKRKMNSNIELDCSQGLATISTGQVVLGTDIRHDDYGGTYITYTLTLGKDTFKISKEIFLRFKHLEHYTIYYAPHSRIILSAEPSEPL